MIQDYEQHIDKTGAPNDNLRKIICSEDLRLI